MWPKYHSKGLLFLHWICFSNKSCLKVFLPYVFYLLFSGQEVDTEINYNNNNNIYTHRLHAGSHISTAAFSSSPCAQEMAEQATCNLLSTYVSSPTWPQIPPAEHHSINWITVHVQLGCFSPFIHISHWLQPSLQQISNCSSEQRASHISSASARQGFVGCTLASKFQGRAGIKDNLISAWQGGERRQPREPWHPCPAGLHAFQHLLKQLIFEVFLWQAPGWHRIAVGSVSGCWQSSCSTGKSLWRGQEGFLSGEDRKLGQTAEQRN